MNFLKNLFSRNGNAPDALGGANGDSQQVSLRRRGLVNLSPETAENVAAAPAPTNAEKEPSAVTRFGVAKKRAAASKVPAEILSVVLRRQVPIRIDEEARSWIGGLPKLPAGTEWPHAKPKKPLHFVAQVDCAALPPELWGGLGPRAGWLLLFVDIEAIDGQLKRPIARVIHVADQGPEAEPPAGLYFARRDVVDVSRVNGARSGVQRQHFRKWPIDLIATSADTSELTGSTLYGAREDDRILSAKDSMPSDSPMTWRGAYAILASLVHAHDATGYESNWLGNKLGLLDYPEPDWRDFNEEWGKRREEPEWNQTGYHEGQTRLREQMHEERRKGWSHRAFKVLEEETARSINRLEEENAKLTNALKKGENNKALEIRQSVAYFKKQLEDRYAHKIYLEELFAQYSEEELVAEIQQFGVQHLDWVQKTQNQLRELMIEAGNMDLNAMVSTREWDAIVAEIAAMRSTYWRRSPETDVLRKLEFGIHIGFDDVIREELLDCYVSPTLLANKLDPDIVLDLEPRMRNLECDKPHKLGGIIDSVYDAPLKKDHILLFQLASDAATGWVFGDLGLVYVSIHRDDLAACRFDTVRSWLEA